MPEDPPIDRQAGVVIGDFVSDSNPKVAHGDRRDEVHYEPDADQLTRVSHLFKPAVLPPDEVTRETPEATTNIVQEAAVVPPAPSVWDASPTEEEDDQDGR